MREYGRFEDKRVRKKILKAQRAPLETLWLKKGFSDYREKQRRCATREKSVKHRKKISNYRLIKTGAIDIITSPKKGKYLLHGVYRQRAKNRSLYQK